jgi:pimeloyl-ACP methyl ester carboxylesterase
MLLPHSKHVSMRLVSWIPTVDDMADATAAMLAAHGYSRAAVVAHSYGTMVASRLVMKYPQLVHSMCLTDPVGGVRVPGSPQLGGRLLFCGCSIEPQCACTLLVLGGRRVDVGGAV